MRILMISAEMAPFAKVGGLADVTAALSRSLAARGHDVRVVLPLYGDLDRKAEKINRLKKLPPLSTRVGQQTCNFSVYMRGSASSAVKVYLIEAADLYDRPGIYGDESGEVFPDALQRSSLHCQAALMLPRLLDWPVDIIHCHDASSAPAILFKRHWYDHNTTVGAAGSVFTIHNLAHQEIHPAESVTTLGVPASMAVYPGILEFHRQLNLMKAGILAADRVNTVSPAYAEEIISDPVLGCGLDGVLTSRKVAFSGILNGADYSTWNPAKDPALPANFSATKLAGKTKCREKLLSELGLKATKGLPLCGFVGRLVSQKGVGLLLPVLERLIGDGFTFAFLGTGETELMTSMQKLADKYPQQLAFVKEFNEPLAHRIYAGSDLFLMPSLFEPCGLSQMYALRYGTIPVVRATGGLVDTIQNVRQDTGTGFVFKDASSEDLLTALRRAQALYQDKKAWANLQQRGFACDFGWELASAGYEALYDAAISENRV